MKEIAAVTGATGMIGKEIVNLLLEKGFHVRILTRNISHTDSQVEIVHGELEDDLAIDKLLEGASSLFHCAAELNNENKMWSSNVFGTQTLLKYASKFNLKYICHLSSVGVIGKFNGTMADEKTKCSPINLYEKSKLESENLLANYKGNAKIVILRPTNVIDKVKNNINSLNRIKILLKGGENAHIVHAQDVATTALYFMDKHITENPDCYIVSYDYEKKNTFAGCHAIVKAIKMKLPHEKAEHLFHLPWQVPYTLRRISKGPCNRGDVCYSSNKLLATGFTFPMGFIGALQDIAKNSDA